MHLLIVRWAYYNEFDPKIAAWLRELIRRGLIMDGEVDERDVRDVSPDDVRPFRRAHFFAGIGGWDLALQYAGWPDSRPVWTGSPPCQPFSNAGKREGAADDRHLWPFYFRLIAECRPATIFGEQVAAAIGNGWLDAVLADLETEGYACAAAVLPACSVGAPHIRQRLWFVADAGGSRLAGRTQQSAREKCAPTERGGGAPLRLDDPQHDGRQQRRQPEHGEQQGAHGILADGPGAWRPWDGAQWLPCLDGKARPVEPGTSPLAHGIPARVVRLRGYGNAIVPQVAAEVIQAFMECS